MKYIKWIEYMLVHDLVILFIRPLSLLEFEKHLSTLCVI